MGLSAIRDKSLIASCKSLFTKGREDKKLSGKEERKRQHPGGCEGAFSLSCAVGVVCRMLSGSITGISWHHSGKISVKPTFCSK